MLLGSGNNGDGELVGRIIQYCGVFLSLFTNGEREAPASAQESEETRCGHVQENKLPLWEISTPYGILELK